MDERLDAKTHFYTGGDERNVVKDRPPVPPGVGVHPRDSQRPPGPQQPSSFTDKHAGLREMMKGVDAEDEVKLGVGKRQAAGLPAYQGERLRALPGLL